MSVSRRLRSQKVLNLPEFGWTMPPMFGSIAVGAKWVVMCENLTLRMLDVTTKSPTSFRIAPDTLGMMHPTSSIVALRAGRYVQIFDLEQRCKLKAVEVVDIEFWAWLDTESLSVVTAKAIHRIPLDANGPMTKQFDRLLVPRREDTVVNFASSADGNWVLLTVRSSQPAQTALQLYSKENGGFVRSIAGTLGCFVHTQKEEKEEKESGPTLLCFTTLDSEGAQLHILELNAENEHGSEHKLPLRGSVDVPVALLSSQNSVYALTKRGLVYVHDVCTEANDTLAAISEDDVLLSLNSQTSLARVLQELVVSFLDFPPLFEECAWGVDNEGGVLVLDASGELLRFTFD